MPANEQGISAQRYRTIPRTLVFITRGKQVLLIKGAPTKRLWANRYNGIGGHVERGEDILTSARRETREETGLEVQDLKLSGIIMVDAGQMTGVTIFVFCCEYLAGDICPSSEGQLEWISLNDLPNIPLVEDLMVILPRVLQGGGQTQPFFARSFYDENEKLRLVFA